MLGGNYKNLYFSPPKPINNLYFDFQNLRNKPIFRRRGTGRPVLNINTLKRKSMFCVIASFLTQHQQVFSYFFLPLFLNTQLFVNLKIHQVLPEIIENKEIQTFTNIVQVMLKGTSFLGLLDHHPCSSNGGDGGRYYSIQIGNIQGPDAVNASCD